MKGILSTICLLSYCILWSQSDFSIEAIAESEAKSATGIVNFSPNANTGNYDLTYHRLEFTIDPNVAFITGDVTSYFEAKENISEVIFDLDNNLIVSQVMQRGSSLSYTQNANDELVITLPQVQNQGVLDSLTVSYSGNPTVSGFGSFVRTSHNGDPIIWTLSEPYGAKAWWPCKQDLIDKIDEIDVYITTPLLNPTNEEYFAVSNGIEQSQTTVSMNKTTHFKHQFPIPAYLIAIAATNYSIYTEQYANNGNPFDIVNYVFPESLVDAQASTPITSNIMDLFTNLFEEYPFAAEKYGHAEFTVNGGMEHTTVSFMGNFSRNLIAHELAHQWFGNKITCGSWQDIWLNEGFATYLSGLVVEDFDGNAAFSGWKQSRINSITSQAGGSVYVPAQDTTSVGRVFNGRLSYSKGSMVLHMLRKKLGDSPFYQGVQDYLVDVNHAFEYAKTAEFQAIMEQSSGEDLSEFFNDWIYNEGYPSYTVEYNQISASQVRFVVHQTQSHNSVDFFEAPVPIRINGSGGEVLNVVLDHSSDSQEFFVNVTFMVSSVEFDPEFDLISKDNSVLLDTSEFILDQDLKLVPNPAETSFEILKPMDMTITSVKIFNVIGQMVINQAFDVSINVSQLSTGLHFVRFETNQGTFHKRLLKK